MKKVTEQEPSKEILRVSRVLQEAEFNVQLLGSGNYVFQKLQALNADDLERVREAFVKANHPRFFKFFSSGLPFGHMEDYEKKVNAAKTLGTAPWKLDKPIWTVGSKLCSGRKCGECPVEDSCDKTKGIAFKENTVIWKRQ